MMVELIDDFFAEYLPAPSGSDKVDREEADEVIHAVAKTVAELTSRQNGIFRQHLIERLREIMKFDDESVSRKKGGQTHAQANSGAKLSQASLNVAPVPREVSNSSWGAIDNVTSHAPSCR